MCVFAGVQNSGGGGMGFSPGSRKLAGSDEEEYNSQLGLGELAGLTITNDADPSNYDVSNLLIYFRVLHYTHLEDIDTIWCTDFKNCQNKIQSLEVL